MALSAKEAIIIQLRKQFREKELSKKLKEKDKELQHIKRAFNRLKTTNSAVKLDYMKQSCGSVSFEEFQKVKKMLEERITILQNQNVEFQDTIMNSTTENTGDCDESTLSYGTNMRMMVYDSIMSQVPTQNVTKLIMKFLERTEHKMIKVPHRSAVELMSIELGLVSDLQTAEIAMVTDHLTIGFDATTQEGVHINSTHFTTKTNCKVMSIEQIAGGTADDYMQHVCGSVDHLARVYSDFHGVHYDECRRTIISNISNTLTDRVAANHAAIAKLEEMTSMS